MYVRVYPVGKANQMNAATKLLADPQAFEDGMHIWRMESPESFLIRVAQYLYRQYPNPERIIREMQR